MLHLNEQGKWEGAEPKISSNDKRLVLLEIARDTSMLKGSLKR